VMMILVPQLPVITFGNHEINIGPRLAEAIILHRIPTNQQRLIMKLIAQFSNGIFILSTLIS
jgi:hypothetical protein